MTLKTPSVLASVPICAGVILLCTGPACRPESRFAEGFSPEFSPGRHHTVSVFGVYRDGQVSSDAWGSLRARVERVLGGARCPIACDSELASTDPRLFRAIDEYATANGPNDDLLHELAPAAEGDLILVIVEGGHMPPPEKVSIVDSPSPGGPSAGGGAGGASGFAMFNSKSTSRDDEVLEFSASLFSVAQGHSVARVELQYSGSNFDEALSEFADRVGKALPQASCGGWQWSAKVDADRIRRLSGG